MTKSKTTTAMLALAVALPNFITPVSATQNNSAMPASEKRMAQSKTLSTEKAKPAELKKMLNKELAEMTPAQKKEIGQARINQLKAISGDEIARGGCFTHGVGCKGTSGFTGGVACCLIIRTGL